MVSPNAKVQNQPNAFKIRAPTHEENVGNLSKSNQEVTRNMPTVEPGVSPEQLIGGTLNKNGGVVDHVHSDVSQ